MRFLELSDSDQFEQLVCEHIITFVPHSPRSPEIPPLSPASNSGGSPCQGKERLLIEATKSIGIWYCDNCNIKNPGTEPECLVCSAARPSPSLLSPPGMQNENPFFSKDKPVDYNVSSLSSNIFTLNNSTATGSDSSRNYTPFSIALLQHQQDGNKSDRPPSSVSVPSQEDDSEVSAGQGQQVIRPLFQIAGAGKLLFSIPTNNENETVDNFESTAEFRPIVKLPSYIKLQSGEENEVVLFSHRAKLYRFDTSSKQWKERGIGDIKILRHKKTGKFRILMRWDQILKLCCNHLIVKGMALTARDEKSLQWITLSDFSEEESKSE